MRAKRIRLCGFAGLMAVLATDALAAGSHGEVGGITHRMMTLMIQLGVIILVAALANALFAKLRLPGIVGELAAGVLIGPFALGALPLPGFPEGLFGIMESGAGEFPVSPELYGICALASVVLLFVVGLETDIRLFMRYSLAGSLVGVGGVVVAFLLGDFMAMLFSPVLFGERLGFLSPPCLFLGIISTPTSAGISARILSEHRRLDSPEGVTIMAAAVIDDVLGIILLAIGMGVIAASRGTGTIDWLHIAVIGAKALGIWLAATIVGLLYSRKISVLLKAFKSHASIAVMALGLALILAGLFEEAGLAMIIGAYVVGLSLSRTDISRVVQERMDSVYALLVPVFFVVMGMLVDVRLLASREVLLFGALYTVIANVAKVSGCGLPALFCNFNPRGALRIALGMLPRGEVTLIIAGTGLAAGMLSREIFGVVIMMVLLTAVLAPVSLASVLRGRRSGLRRETADQAEEAISFSFPSVRIAEFMVDKLRAAFEAEGFFVHTLSRAERIFQLRKDDVVIGFRQQGRGILFDCGRAQAAFVSTAMYEVMAEFEQTIKELRKPVDRAEIGKRMQAERSVEGPAASLRGYIERRALQPRLRGKTKVEIIDELLALLQRSGRIRSVERAREDVMAREESMSTGMQFGIAIPHARTDGVDRLVCAVGISADGVDFDSMDGQPSRIFVLVLSPRSESAPQMQFMSMVGQALNETGRDELLACKTAAEMYDVLAGRSAPGRSFWRRG